MTVPMMVLAFGSAFLGLILGPTGFFTTWLEPVTGGHPEGAHPVLNANLLIVLTVVLVLAGAALAWLKYWRDDVPETAPAGNLLTRAARNDLYQDQVNEALLMRPGIHLTRSLVFADGKGVDGAAGGLAALVGGTSSRLRKVQNGFARSYALTMLAGVVAILGALWVIQ
jgi:NADH-quinone oxidoreductase subunit L